jgi:hypothetical protein
MFTLYNAQIDAIALHRVGNKSRNEPLHLSKDNLQLDDEISVLLKQYFFSPFNQKEVNYYCFSHEVDLEYHPVYQAVQRIFENPQELHEQSKDIAAHLYEQSRHAHINNGELYVAHFSDVRLDNEKIDAIGIFKSEVKQDFFEFSWENENLNIHLRRGISAQKLDKGCLIFNTQAEEGYKVLTVDRNRYDAKYWPEAFLSIAPLTDEVYFTKNYLKLCKDFAKDVVLEAEDKQQEVLFMNRAMNHFASRDTFEETHFLNDVIENPALVPEFKHYKTERGPKYSIEDVSSFGIANQAVSEARRKFKNQIHLDTNIHIKLDFINPESAEKFVEKGWDEERQMYYYLLYFNKENKS